MHKKETSMAGISSSTTKSITTRLKEIKERKDRSARGWRTSEQSFSQPKRKLLSIYEHLKWSFPAEVLLLAPVVAGLVVSNIVDSGV